MVQMLQNLLTFPLAPSAGQNFVFWQMPVQGSKVWSNQKCMIEPIIMPDSENIKIMLYKFKCINCCIEWSLNLIVQSQTDR